MQGNFDAISTLLNTTKLDNTYLASGLITNSFVSASAAIAVSKLASGTSGQVLANVGTTPTYVDSAGDVTWTTSGTTLTTAIASGVIVNADVNASAAIAYSKLNLGTSIVNADVSASAGVAVSKLAAGTSAQVLLNSSTPTPTWTTLSGDVTVGATGTTAIGAGKVTPAMFSSTVTSTTNAGNALGTINYTTIGPIKVAWGITAEGTGVSNGTDVSWTITLPSFFTTIQSVTCSVDTFFGSTNLGAARAHSTSSTSITVGARNISGGTAGATFGWCAIGV